MSEADTMSHNSIQSYLEECFTETVFAAAMLKTELWNNRTTPETKLLNFYKSFMQLHSMTFYRLDQKGVKCDSSLQVNVRNWFAVKLPTNMKERNAAVKNYAIEGINLFNEWSENIQKLSIIKVGI